MHAPRGNTRRDSDVLQRKRRGILVQSCLQVGEGKVEGLLPIEQQEAVVRDRDDVDGDSRGAPVVLQQERLHDPPRGGRAVRQQQFPARFLVVLIVLQQHKVTAINLPKIRARWVRTIRNVTQQRFRRFGRSHAAWESATVRLFDAATWFAAS